MKTNVFGERRDAAGRYQLELPNGARLSVSAGFDAQELEHLLKLVGTCSA
jgi:hypothetical protein